jgi:hypothetical protein
VGGFGAVGLLTGSVVGTEGEPDDGVWVGLRRVGANVGVVLEIDLVGVRFILEGLSEEDGI